MTKTKVAKQTKAEITQILTPDGYEMELSQDDIKTPSIVLYQKMTDMIEFEDSDVKAGEFVNPVTGDIFGTSFEAVVVKVHVTARVFGDKDPETGRKEVLKFSRDAVNWDDGSRITPIEWKWTEDGSHAVKSYHYLVIVKGHEMPALLTFKGASAKHAKTLNANLMYMRPSWRAWIRFSSAVEESNGNKYHVIQSRAQPKSIVEPEVASLSFGLYQTLASGAVLRSNELEDEESFDGESVAFSD